VNNKKRNVKPKKHLHSILPVAVVAIATSLPAESFGQTDFVLKLGSIEGDVQFEGYEKQIDILSWSWGVQNNTDPGNPSGGGGVARPQFSSVQFSKSTDRATAPIFLNMAKQTVFSEAKLTALSSGVESSVTTLEVTLTDLVINSMSAGASEDSNTDEVFSLAPAKVKMQFYSQNSTTGESIKGDCFEWDIVSNSEVKC